LANIAIISSALDAHPGSAVAAHADGASFAHCCCTFKSHSQRALDAVKNVFGGDGSKVKPQVGWLHIQCGAVCVGQAPDSPSSQVPEQGPV
jgi:hypothetical protein